MKQPRTLSIGGATYDLFVRTGNETAQGGNDRALCFPVGAKIPVERIIETCGGGASNTAVGLRRLGCDSAFCGVVGGDQWGGRLLARMREEGVDTAPATVVEGEETSSSIILSVTGGDRVVLYNAGTNIHLQDAVFDRDAAREREWITLTHIQKQGCMIFDDIVSILSGRDGRVGLTWNPGSTQINVGIDTEENRALLAVTSILLLNKEEALAFAGEVTVEAALASLSRKGARIVCITDGKNGAVATDGEKTSACPAMRDTEVVDATGAGDAFGTGLTWAILSGLDLPEALRAGTINATSVLGTIGAQEGLLTDTEMKNRLSSLRLPVQVTPLHP